MSLWPVGAENDYLEKKLDGELYDARHDRARATEHYGAFLDLWKDADPDLQPVVMAVRTRNAELGRLEGR